MMPRWSDVIELIEVITETNEWGDTVETKHFRTVFANRRSIRQSEFYQAMTTDLRPEIMFEIRESDYDGEKMVRAAGNRVFLESNARLESEKELGSDNKREYHIRRTHSKHGEVLELICEGVNNDGPST